MKLHLGHVLALFALLLATGAGYISVTGWGKLFAGQATIVMIVMAIIEAAKVVTTIYLHKYSKKTKLALKGYLTAGVIATMILTSVGIYGFLTGAYQDTANKMEVQSGEVSILEGKKQIFEDKITKNEENIDSKKKRMEQLTDLRTTQETRLDSLLTNNHWHNARKTREDIDKATEEIQYLGNEIDSIIAINSTLSDSVSTYQIKILEVKANSDIAAEIGPLKYISSLTGRPMDDIINYLVLTIIFIFDPMAISLVLATNNVFDQRDGNKGADGPDDGPNNGPDSIEKYTKDGMDHFVVRHDSNEDVSIETITEEPKEEFEPEPDGSDNLEEVVEKPADEPTDEPAEKDSDEPSEEDENDAQTQIDFDTVGEVENEEELSAEEQLKENKDNIKKLSPVIPTGKVERDEIKEIREKRGFSVDVPEPNKHDVQRIGTNKEIRDGNPKVFYFKRPNRPRNV